MADPQTGVGWLGHIALFTCDRYFQLPVPPAVSMLPFMATNNAEDVIRAARRRSAALVRGDRRALAALHSKDFVYTNASGVLLDAEQYLRLYVDSGTMRWQAQELANIEVRLHQHTAVLTCRVHDHAIYQGEPFEGEFQSTQVWVRDGDEWRCAAIQTTEIK